MRLTKKNHSACIVGYTALFLEMVVSGFYTNLDGFFFATRLGILAVYVAACEKLYTDVLKWVGVIIVILSVSGIRKEYGKIEKEKFEKNSKLEQTKIEKPPEPKLEDCSLQPKYARPDCAKDNKDLQLTYDKNLARYNSKIEKSENSVKNLKTDLDFYDCQPILIYCVLIGGITMLSVIGVKNPNIEVKTKKAENSNLVLTNLEKVKLIESRNKKEKIPQKLLCEDYGISLSEFKRLRAKGKPKIEPSEKNFPGLEGLEEVNV